MKLNKEQYIAAHHKNGPMLVLAGPGSGKTHLLVERITLMIEEYHIPPENILVITFSKKAARQMQSRFEKRIEGRSYPVTFGTFHAVFYHMIRQYDPNINRLITEEEQCRFIKQAVKNCGSLSAGGGNVSSAFSSDERQGDAFYASKRGEQHLELSEDDIDRLIGMIGSYKNFGKDFYVRSEAGRSIPEDDREGFEKLYTEYGRLCRQAEVLDFDDMILMCSRILYEHESVLRKWQDIYRYILVDEFQDINEGQYNVLRLLAGDSRNVFAVGDDDQSIYAFRGARPELMKKFLHQYIGCRRVTLTMNYRCCENVIGAADTVIRHNTDRLERPMQRHLPSKRGGIVELVSSENTNVQAAYVCDMISTLISDGTYRFKDIAVLYRSAHCAVMFEQMARQRGIPLKVTNETGETSREEKIRKAYIKAHDGMASRADFFLIMNNPPRGLSREALCVDTGNYIEDMKAYYKDDPEKLEKVRDLENTIAGCGNTSFDLLKGSKSTGCSKTEKIPHHNVNITDDRSKTKDVSPRPESDVRQMDGVNVMTAHASKGLEFPCVFIIGLQEGLFPHIKSIDEPLVQEERRLIYVAMTRAIERLYMCTVSTEHGKRPSRFASEACEKMRYINDIIKLTRQ